MLLVCIINSLTMLCADMRYCVADGPCLITITPLLIDINRETRHAFRLGDHSETESNLAEQKEKQRMSACLKYVVDMD